MNLTKNNFITDFCGQIDDNTVNFYAAHVKSIENASFIQLSELSENTAKLKTAQVRFINAIDKKNLLVRQRAAKCSILYRFIYLHFNLTKIDHAKINNQFLRAIEYKNIKNLPLDERLSRIKKNRLDDLKAESKRLEHLFRKLPNLSLSLSARVTLLQSLEIEQAVAHDHYTLYHGQNLEASFFCMFLKEQAKLQGLDTKNRQFLRDDPNPELVTNETFYESIYKKKGSNFFDNRHARNELLSVSGTLRDPKPYESASFFMSMNKNVLNPNKDQFFLEFLKKRNIVKGKLLDRIPSIRSVSGGIHVIIIPKAGVSTSFKDRYFYLSHPYGIIKEDSKAEGASGDNVLRRLEKKNFEQYRVLYPGLAQDPTARVQYIAASRSKVERKKHRAEARRIAEGVQAAIASRSS